jgi:hypothetical protein
VPVLQQWRGAPLTAAAANAILVGHLNHPASALADPAPGAREAWSWKVVCGANPAYDAFPCQHQVFYPSEKSPASLW